MLFLGSVKNIHTCVSSEEKRPQQASDIARTRDQNMKATWIGFYWQQGHFSSEIYYTRPSVAGLYISSAKLVTVRLGPQGLFPSVAPSTTLFGPAQKAGALGK